MAKPDKTKLAEMRAREAVEAPDFAAAAQAPDGDGPTPYLPQPCPVVPLGKNGSQLYFLDRSKQIITASTRAEKGDLMLWFGNDWLVDNFQKMTAGKKGERYPVEGEFDQRLVQIALVEDCYGLGIFNPQGRVFGRGAHRMPHDPAQLVLHMGDRVMRAWWVDAAGERRSDPDVVRAGRLNAGEGRMVFFPALEKLPQPAVVAADSTEAADLLAFFGKWYWKDRRASTLLLLGMTCQMYVCGALNWRAHMWLSGPTASGKSSLQAVVRALHEDWCLHTEDASEAAIRQVLGDDTLPVMIDEAEAHDNQARLQAVINLMKKGSSGAKIYRGSQDHKAQSFTAQSCFLFSSVLHPNFRGEDRNRIAILEMVAIPADAADLHVDEAAWQQLGRRLRKRMIEQWPRFDRTLADYKAAIAARGYEGRWRDTYGTLLACADLALYDSPTTAGTLGGEIAAEQSGPARVAELVSIVAPTMTLARMETESDVQRILNYLMMLALPGSGGRPPEPIGVWIDRAMTYQRNSDPNDMGPELSVNTEALAKLKAYGLRLVNLRAKPGPGDKWAITDALPERPEEAWLAVAGPNCKPLLELLAGSDWAGGAWTQSLGKVEHAFKLGEPMRFGPVGTSRAVMVPLMAFKGHAAGDDDEQEGLV